MGYGRLDSGACICWCDSDSIIAQLLSVVLTVVQVWISLYLDTVWGIRISFMVMCNVLAIANVEQHYQIR